MMLQSRTVRVSILQESPSLLHEPGTAIFDAVSLHHVTLLSTYLHGAASVLETSERFDILIMERANDFRASVSFP